jgi:hypothetical protein
MHTVLVDPEDAKGETASLRSIRIAGDTQDSPPKQLPHFAADVIAAPVSGLATGTAALSRYL